MWMEDTSQVLLRCPEPSGPSSPTGLGCKVLLLQHFDIEPVRNINKFFFFQSVCSILDILGIKKMVTKSEYQKERTDSNRNQTYQTLRQRRMKRNIRYSENSFQSFSHKKKGRDSHLLLLGLEGCCHMILRCLVVFTNLFASTFTEKLPH